RGRFQQHRNVPWVKRDVIGVRFLLGQILLYGVLVSFYLGEVIQNLFFVLVFVFCGADDDIQRD
ncbi:MAG: hypothetical protein KME52_28735, partial [Desmonostoc geniculatum HA4340-LM1]|nr:hypothetical protein [Desmonostoc geniculatum HA4340-LM1]